MICKNCGQKYTFVPDNVRIDDCHDKSLIPDYYTNYTWMKICSKCQSVIDYNDLELQDFLCWLNFCDEGKDKSYNLKGKALIRYFHLDELLKEKKDVGD